MSLSGSKQVLEIKTIVAKILYVNDVIQISPEMVLKGYRIGVFPMADSRLSDIEWYYADPRAILPLDEKKFHISGSLKRRLRSGRFKISFDKAFQKVIQYCAQQRKHTTDTWINQQIIDVYCQLHRSGDAHSVEAWQEDENGQNELVGGLYGVVLGGAFFGESMFYRSTDASKVCLVKLVEHLRNRGFVLLDAQFPNPHLNQFGCVEMAFKQYLQLLHKTVDLPVTW